MSEKVVKFFNNGRFSNNMFQYIAAEIIKKIYNYDRVEPTRIINLEFNTVINDEMFTKIIHEYMRGNIYQIDTSKDILLQGFFQRSEIFMFEREYILSLFNKDNKNYISNNIQICNIFKYKTKHIIEPSENDLTIHIRLGDFYDKESNKSQIYDPTYLKNIIKTIDYNKLYIVTEVKRIFNENKEVIKSDKEWYEAQEQDYLKEFDELNPIYISGNLGDDFDFLLKSKKLLLSASTLSWLAAFFGKATEVHIPYNSYYGGYENYGQSLAEFSKECKVYYDTEYWIPKQINVSS